MAMNHGFERKPADELVDLADQPSSDGISVEEISIRDDITVVPDLDTEPTADTPGPVDPDNWRRAALIDVSATGKRPRSVGRWIQILAIPLLFLLAGAVWYTVVRIQDNIEEAAAEILTDAGIDSTTLTFDASFRDVVVTGTLPPGVSAEEIEQLLESGEGRSGEDIRNATVDAIQIVAALDLAIAADGDTLVLDGSVPNQDQFDALADAANRAGVSVTNDVTVAGRDSESEDADALIASLTSILPRLGTSISDARLTVDNTSLTGSIEAANPAAMAELSRIPAIANGTITLTSLGELNAEFTYDGSRIVLNGDVLSAAHQQTLVEASAEAVGAGNVIDNLTVLDADEAVEGADDKVAAVADLLRTFDGFNSADVNLTDTSVTVNGEAFDPDTREPIVEALSAAGAVGLRTGGDITLGHEFTLQEEIDLLQAELDALQASIRENVRFEVDSDILTTEAGATLDQVVDAMDRYSRPVVEVGGHTDSRGDAEYNRALSAERAATVADYIASAGIDADRLNSVGFGESRPIADNLVEAGRDENRRVEFTARESF